MSRKISTKILSECSDLIQRISHDTILFNIKILHLYTTSHFRNNIALKNFNNPVREAQLLIYKCRGE